jgi:hypothetical protein
MSASKMMAIGLASAMGVAMAFQPSTAVTKSYSTALNVAVDPTVVSKKDYEDICGVSFDKETLEQRLRRTNFLYPKHVEVIEDIAPIAAVMVDEIVRSCVWCVRVRVHLLSCVTLGF